jgi:uncharacterized membrane protein YdjX (TVP38/TMEM64 family)
VAEPANTSGELLGRARNYRRRLAVGVVLLAVVLAAANALSLNERIPGFLDAARSLGAWGIVVYVAAYVAAALLAIPVSPITVAAGATYGALAGAVIGVFSVVVSGSCAFLVGRFVASHPHALAVGSGRVARAVRAIGRGGFRLVLVLRLAPVMPFSILNFAFGATPTTLAQFALGTLVGTIPSQLGYAFLGSVVTWPSGPARIAAQAGLVTAAVLLSVAATTGAIAILKRAPPGSPPG